MDAFPHTRRPLPWLGAIFVALILMVPIDATTIKVHLPINSQIDRFGIIILVGFWVLFGGDQRTVWRSTRSRYFVIFVALFWAVMLAGLLTGAPRIIRLGEWNLATKQVALVASFFVLGWFLMSALRREDLPGFGSMLIGLGTIFAIGVIIESRTGYNVFYSVSHAILKPIATVGPSPTQLNGALTDDGRPNVVGSTDQGLAAVAVLASVMAFALIRLFDDQRDRDSRLRNLVAFILMAAATLATQKKTGIILVPVVILYVGAYRPKQLVKLWPLAIVAIPAIHFVAPGNVGSLLDPTLWFKSSSSAHRSNDFSTIWPDVLAHPIFGLGFGSANVDQPDYYRVLDNQTLGILWQMGLAGLLSWVAMILSPIYDARRARRDKDRRLSEVAIAASAGCLVFMVASCLFDALSFSQAPYLFFVMAALCVVSSGAPARWPAPVSASSPKARELVSA